MSDTIEQLFKYAESWRVSESACVKRNGLSVLTRALIKQDKADLSRKQWLECDELTADELAGIPEEPIMVPSVEKAVDIQWEEAVTFVSNTEEMPHKQYRLVMFIAGHDVEGPWSDYQAAVFKVECLRLARAGVGFSVEFK